MSTETNTVEVKGLTLDIVADPDAGFIAGCPDCGFTEFAQSKEKVEEFVIEHFFKNHPGEAEKFCEANGFDYVHWMAVYSGLSEEEIALFMADEEEVTQETDEDPEPEPEPEPAPEPVKTILVCPHCSKEYQLERYFTAHVEKCAPVLVEPVEPEEPADEPAEEPIDIQAIVHFFKEEFPAMVGGLFQKKEAKDREERQKREEALGFYAEIQELEKLLETSKAALKRLREKVGKPLWSAAKDRKVVEFLKLLEMYIAQNQMGEAGLLYNQGEEYIALEQQERSAALQELKSQLPKPDLTEAQEWADAQKAQEQERFEACLNGTLRTVSKKFGTLTLMEDVSLQFRGQIRKEFKKAKEEKRRVSARELTQIMGWAAEYQLERWGFAKESAPQSFQVADDYVDEKKMEIVPRMKSIVVSAVYPHQEWVQALVNRASHLFKMGSTEFPDSEVIKSPAYEAEFGKVLPHTETVHILSGWYEAEETTLGSAYNLAIPAHLTQREREQYVKNRGKSKGNRGRGRPRGYQRKPEGALVEECNRLFL